MGVESVRNVVFNWKLWEVLVSKDRCLRQRVPRCVPLLAGDRTVHAGLLCSYTLLWEAAMNTVS